MGKQKKSRTDKKSNFAVIEIGGLEPVLENSTMDYLTTWWDEAHEHYEPPVNLDHLTRLLRVNAHHESAIHCKRNTVLAGYIAPAAVARKVMSAVAFDYILYGNAYLRIVPDRAGRPVRLDHLHARTMRRAKERGRYHQVLPTETIKFAEGEVIHVSMYAPESSVYGLPEYLGALSSVLLNEQGTLFRRKYYVNGAHMGFILHTAGDIDDDTMDIIEDRLKDTKGVGNFRNLMIHTDSGEDKVTLIPVGDFAKDDFEKIKNISRDDIISAHRVPPQILAVLTDNKLPTTGDLDKVVDLYHKNVVRPIQLDLMDEINQYLPDGSKVDFEPYDLGADNEDDTPE
ncbi:MAG: phage portal protein [Deltaproteobacteria bacterium]|nr:phage portal protein [Deltaproteobacteria bacterium]